MLTIWEFLIQQDLRTIHGLPKQDVELGITLVYKYPGHLQKLYSSQRELKASQAAE